jgi:isopenicillin N synthase-like dioxygenase
MSSQELKTETVPVIDIENLNSAATLVALDEACREWGFFQIVNHGIDEKIIDRLKTEAYGFFSQPKTVKRLISRTSDNPWGYYDKELTKNTLDWKEIFDYGPADGEAMRPQWPRDLPHFRAAVLGYYGACESLAFRLLSALSLNLGVSRRGLLEAFQPTHTSFLRINHYPKCPQPERPQGIKTPSKGHLGLNHHTDAGALTILLQADTPGLEVYRNGDWHLVEPRSDALVVNVGDIVQVWSNDQYVAALHRVVAHTDTERFSVPFFFSPAYSADYAPLPTMITASSPQRYRSINWGDFYRKRTAGDYADVGEEVQISHYSA